MPSKSCPFYFFCAGHHTPCATLIQARPPSTKRRPTHCTGRTDSCLIRVLAPTTSGKFRLRKRYGQERNTWSHASISGRRLQGRLGGAPDDLSFLMKTLALAASVLPLSADSPKGYDPDTQNTICRDCALDLLWTTADDIIPLIDPWEQTSVWLQTVFLRRWFRFRAVPWLWMHAYRRHAITLLHDLNPCVFCERSDGELMTPPNRQPTDFVLTHWMRKPDTLTAFVLDWSPGSPPAGILRVLMAQHRLRLWWRRRPAPCPSLGAVALSFSQSACYAK